MNEHEKKRYIAEYSTLPTANISDAMDILRIGRGAIIGLSPLYMKTESTVGFAFTIKQIRRQSEYDGVSLAKQGNAIDELTKEHDVVVVETGGITDVSTGGAIQLLRAKIRGASGYITDGSLRDINEIKDLEMPSYVGGSSPIRSVQDLETVGVNIPVEMKGVSIVPGDLIVMDDTGILVIPQDRIEEVLKKAKEINEKEKKMTELIKAGHSLVEARKLKDQL